MPKKGFKSVTIRAEVYDHLHSKYKNMKPQLEKMGINSFAGFWAFTFEKFMNDEKVFNAFLDSVAKDQIKNFQQLRTDNK